MMEGTRPGTAALRVAALLAVAALSVPAAAAPINYLEATDGELPDTAFVSANPPANTYGDLLPSPAGLGPVDNGANTVSGTSASNPGGNPSTDRDGFRFSVPTGLTVQSILVSIAQADTSDSQTLRFEFYDESGFSDPFAWSPAGNMLVSVISPNAANGALFPIPGGELTEGDYAVVVFNQDIDPTPSNLIYTITLTVVPEPATAAVLATGAAVMLLRRRSV